MSSFIVGTGEDMINEALEPKVDASKILAKLGTGKTYKVRALPTAAVKYFCHSAYGVFNSTPCTKPMGQPDLYDKAVDMLYKDAKAAEEAGATEEEVKVIKDKAYALKAKERYMIGFVNLATGEPIIIDFTSKQGKGILASLKEYKDELPDYAFKLSKVQTGAKKTDTVVNFDLIVNAKKGLTDEEQASFAATEGFEFDMELFGNALQVNEESRQLEDLHKFGFDVTRLGFDKPNVAAGNTGSEEGAANGEPADTDF